jgi:hypothetical protein
MNNSSPAACERPAARVGGSQGRAHPAKAGSGEAFAQQIATFYPYASDPENAPGKSVSGAAQERLRPAATQAGSGLMRRRHTR